MRLSNTQKKTNIIISSSTDFLNKSENKKSEFINVVKNQLNIDIDPYDFVAIHELPNKNKDIYKTIVKFHFHETKSKIFKNIKKLKDTNIYISDHLTKYNSEIFYKARNLLKDSKIKYCWTVNGITFIKKTESSDKENFLNVSDLILYCSFIKFCIIFIFLFLLFLLFTLLIYLYIYILNLFYLH